MNLGALYGQIDKNLFGGMLPGGSDSPTVGASRTPKYTPRKEAVQRSKARTKTAPPRSGRGSGAATFSQPDTRTPLERAPVGQVMTLGGVKGFKNSKGEWQAGNPDAASVQAAPQGIIPVPTLGTGGYAAAGYLKSLAGQLGRPFKILKNDEQVAFEDQTKEVGRQKDGTVIFNRDSAIAAGKEPQYNELGTDLGNKVLGRYTTKTGVDGSDIATDQYDTNRGVGYHLSQIFGGNRTAGERISSAIALPHRALDDLGLTNPSPYGTSQVVGTPSSKPAPATAVVVDPVAQPATAYAVKAGDTLNSIARERGTTVADLIKRNNISNPDLIQIGQQIK